MAPHLFRVAAASALFSSALLAQGPDPALLPADTTFVVHVELAEVARVLQVDRILEIEEGGEPARVLERLDRELGFHPLRDVRAVTVFGSDLEHGHPTVMLTTGESIDGVLGRLRDAGVLEGERHGGVRFERLSFGGLARFLGVDADADDDGGVLFVREVGRQRVILVGERARDLLPAARVLLGEDESAEQAGRVLQHRPGRATILYAEIGEALENLTRRTPASKVAEKIRGLTAVVTERDGKVVLELAAETETERDARDVSAVVNGLRGLLSLADAADEVPAAVLDALEDARAEASGRRITLRFEVAVETIRSLVHDEVRPRRRVRVR